MKFPGEKIVLALVLSVLQIACTEEPTGNATTDRPLDLRAGTRFMAVSSFDAPAVSRIDVPAENNMDAVWGATGRDDQGRIYFGVSSHGGDPRTAELYQFDPASGVWKQQGDVITELRRAGYDEAGLGQNKLHSKIVAADDGYLYFSSFDEEGETLDKNPVWGGHLWRKRPDEQYWEHVLATPEALIAVNTMGRYVYALGYWGHVLYSFDTSTERVASRRVGSVPGHISRNFLVDANEYAFVPSVSRLESGIVSTRLQQFDADMELLAEFELPGYSGAEMSKNQGIVAFTNLRDGSIAFVAGRGELYRLVTGAEGQARVDHLGKIHPEGESAIKSLFTFNGGSLIAGVTRKPGSRDWEWVIHELGSGIATARPLMLGLDGVVLLYGSLTKDDFGAFYVAGRHKSRGSKRPQPLILRLAPL